MFLVPCLLGFTANAALVNVDDAKTITAPKIEYNVKTAEIKTTGKTTVVTSGGQSMTLKDSYLSSKGEVANASDIELLIGKRTFVTADSIERSAPVTIAKKATYTACYECDKFGNAWEVSLSKLKHNANEQMLEFYNPVFWVYNVPVFWFPFLEWPDPTVKYKSGFLTPSIGSTNNMGTQIDVPFYVNFSDTHDATVTVSYLTQENPLFGLEHRLNMRHSEFRTNGSFTRNKAGENRWHVFNSDVIELGQNARAKIFLNRTSDNTYLQKYGFYDDQPYLDSGARLEVFGQSGYATAEARIFQELRSDVTNGMYTIPSGDILPNIRGVYQTAPIYGETFATFRGDFLGINSSTESSQRMIGEARIVSPWTIWGGQRITLGASARYDLYNFQNTLLGDGNQYDGLKSRFLPSGYLEWGLPLVRLDENWTQVIEPRARLTIIRHINPAQYAMLNDSAGALLSDSTLFADKRFSGFDLWENGTYADYGARWAAFDRTGQKIEFFLGQSYDFTRRVETDPNSGFYNGRSDYVGRIEYDNGSWFGLMNRYRFAREDLSARHLETTARVGSSRNFVYGGHIWATQFLDAQTMDKDINEFVGGIQTYLTSRLGLRFNMIYNATEQHFQRHGGALFYEHPCYSLSLEYRRDNAVKEDFVGNTTIKFNFEIKMTEM